MVTAAIGQLHNFHCKDMHPLRENFVKSNETSHYEILFKDPENGDTVTTLTPGKNYILKLRGTNDEHRFTEFALRAFWERDDHAQSVGVYTARQNYEDLVSKHTSCGEVGEKAIRNKDKSNKYDIQAEFVLGPMAMEIAGKLEVEEYWLNITSGVIPLLGHNVYFMASSRIRVSNKPPQPEDNETPKIDLHDKDSEEQAALKAKEAYEKSIAYENSMSEGDWTKQAQLEEEAHEREIQQELEDYERAQAEEEKRREERIRAEILDQEEHEYVEPQEPDDDSKEDSKEDDTNVIDIDDKDDDNTNAAMRIVSSFTAVSITVAVLLL
jgi:hypothetical protein